MQLACGRVDAISYGQLWSPAKMKGPYTCTCPEELVMTLEPVTMPPKRLPKTYCTPMMEHLVMNCMQNPGLTKLCTLVAPYHFYACLCNH